MSQPKVSVQLLKDGFAQVKLCDRVHILTRVLKRPGKGGRVAKVQTAYVGFKSELSAQRFITRLRELFPTARALLRTSERLSTPYEVKLWEFEGIEQFLFEISKKV
jgi:hypothetical protein